MRDKTAADEKAWYAAFKAHDARFDGRVFICVSSTGIYCRPVCRVRMPREANCTFHKSAAAAEAAGFRPCRRCRPELAPGLSPIDGAARLARAAATVLDEDLRDDAGIAELAARLGVSDRHLRRVFADEFGVSPVQYRQTARLLLAKSLLTDTGIPVTAVAMAAGFGSIRRFNSLFKTRYGMPPSALRQHRTNASDGLALMLGYRPPYRWDALLAFLAARTIPGIDSVSDGVYRRAVAARSGGKTYRGWITVAHAERKTALAATLSPSLLPAASTVITRIRRMFDIDCDPAAVYATLQTMNGVKAGLCAPGVRLPGSFDPFEMAVRAILGQQITVKAARTLATRLAAAFGEPVETPFAEITRTFPAPEKIAALSGIEGHLGPLGVIGARARSIAALADAMAAGTITLSPTADAEREMERLLALPGFGPWTVQYLAMRALAWPDAFPHTDYGIKKALGDMPPAALLALAEQWRPWRSYAAINLWNSL